MAYNDITKGLKKAKGATKPRKKKVKRVVVKRKMVVSKKAAPKKAVAPKAKKAAPKQTLGKKVGGGVRTAVSRRKREMRKLGF